LEAPLNQEQLTTIEDVQKAMFAQRYIADRSLATTVFLALKRRKPLLLEGEPGVGKTEIAKVLATMLDTRLIRLQCYEGIDINTAVYEWNYRLLMQPTHKRQCS
jgi:MoxR-like ATPase